MTELIILNIVSPIVTAFIGWLFGRRQRNAETNSTVIDNMQKSLDFYIALYKKDQEVLAKLQEEQTIMDKKMEEKSKEIVMLRNQVFSLMQSICTDLSCTLRRKDMELLKKCETDIINENKDEKES